MVNGDGKTGPNKLLGVIPFMCVSVIPPHRYKGDDDCVDLDTLLQSLKLNTLKGVQKSQKSQNECFLFMPQPALSST